MLQKINNKLTNLLKKINCIRNVWFYGTYKNTFRYTILNNYKFLIVMTDLLKQCYYFEVFYEK